MGPISIYNFFVSGDPANDLGCHFALTMLYFNLGYLLITQVITSTFLARGSKNLMTNIYYEGIELGGTSQKKGYFGPKVTHILALQVPKI